jgi:hypothetical protein
MDFHGGLVDVRLQSIGRIRERWKFKSHWFSS